MNMISECKEICFKHVVKIPINEKYYDIQKIEGKNYITKSLKNSEFQE